MATMRDVAAHAGVSPKTVSRVLRNEGYVRAEVRERVQGNDFAEVFLDLAMRLGITPPASSPTTA